MKFLRWHCKHVHFNHSCVSAITSPVVKDMTFQLVASHLVVKGYELYVDKEQEDNLIYYCNFFRHPPLFELKYENVMRSDANFMSLFITSSTSMNKLLKIIFQK